MAGPRLSIDFGTTNTAAAWVDPQGHIHEIRLSHTSTLMPSAVFAERGPTGAGVVVGSAAINLSATAPDAFEPNPKRRLRESDIILGGHRFDTTELVAAVLRSVIGTATTVAGTPFRQVTLTHPDGWAGHLQNRLRDAAIAAGLDRQRIRLITEAQAAAHYYSAHRDLPADSRICVFDFGAGTCDVAVLDRTPTGYTVTASDGLDDLGGTDIDGRIFDWTLRHISEHANHLMPQLHNPHARLTLIDRIRDAKETLSAANKAIIAIPGAGAPIQLTRGEFDTLIYRDVQRAAALARRVIDAAQHRNPGPVSRIYLVGGSSHIPLVHRELSALGPIATLGDPKTVVVQGALLAQPASPPPPPPPPPPTAGARVTIPAAIAGRSTMTVTAAPNSYITAGQPVASGHTTPGRPAFTLDSPVEGIVRKIHWRPEKGVTAGRGIVSIAPMSVSDDQLPHLPRIDAIITARTPEPPPETGRKSRRGLLLGLGALLVAVLVAITATLIINGQDDEPNTDAASSNNSSGTSDDSTSGSDSGTSPDDSTSGCVLTDVAAPTTEQCALLERIPSEIRDNSYVSCKRAEEPSMTMLVSGITCWPSSMQSSPYYEVRVYDFGTAATAAAITFGFVEKPGATYPDVGTKFSPNSYTSYSMAGTDGYNMLCSTRETSQYGSCIFYDPAVKQTSEVHRWWIEQPYL